jgi:excisionase family DNA binding protein
VAASEEQFLSLEDVAARLQVSDQTVRRWIKSGKLTAYKPGLEYRIRATDLEEFLRAREVRPKAPRRSPSEPSFNDVLAEERRTSEYQRWAKFADFHAERWERRIKAGDFDSSSLDEFFALFEHAQSTLILLGLQEKAEQPPGYPHTFGPIMNEAIMRFLFRLPNSLAEALRTRGEESDNLVELEQFRSRLAEQEATVEEAIRRGA